MSYPTRSAQTCQVRQSELLGGRNGLLTIRSMDHIVWSNLKEISTQSTSSWLCSRMLTSCTSLFMCLCRGLRRVVRLCQRMFLATEREDFEQACGRRNGACRGGNAAPRPMLAILAASPRGGCLVSLSWRKDHAHRHSIDHLVLVSPVCCSRILPIRSTCTALHTSVPCTSRGARSGLSVVVRGGSRLHTTRAATA